MNKSHVGTIYRQNSKPMQARNEESVSKMHWLAKGSIACSFAKKPLGLKLLWCPRASCLHVTVFSCKQLCHLALHPCPSVLCLHRLC